MEIQPLAVNAAPRSEGAEKQDAALRKACREFESFLVGQLLKKMRATVPKTDLFGSNREEETFRDMLDDEVAKEVSKEGAFGIGDVLYSQLSRE